MRNRNPRRHQIVQAPPMTALLLKQPPLTGEKAEILIIARLELRPSIRATWPRP